MKDGELLTKVFIIHAEVDLELAKKFQNLVGKAIDCEELDKEVFLSSESIAVGDDWFEEICKAIGEAKIGIALITPSSRFRPWVYLEAGGFKLGQAQDKKKLFLVLCNGIDESALPDLFRQMRLQCRDIGSNNQEGEQKAKGVLKRLLNEIATSFLNKSPGDDPSLDGKVMEVLKLAKGEGGWEEVKQGIRSSRIEGSPIQFFRLLQRAKKEIFIAGQNLHFLVKEAETNKELIFKKLKENKGFKIRMLICNVKYKHFVKAWALVTDIVFKQHLKTVTEKFRKWQLEADDQDLGLEIKVTEVVPVSIIFMDPEDKNFGTLTVIPNAYEKKPGPRPSFCISANERDNAFKHYLDNYEFVWNEAKPIQSIKQSLIVRGVLYIVKRVREWSRKKTLGSDRNIQQVSFLEY